MANQSKPAFRKIYWNIFGHNFATGGLNDLIFGSMPIIKIYHHLISKAIDFDRTLPRFLGGGTYGHNPQSILNLAQLVLPYYCFRSNSRYSGGMECILPLSLFLSATLRGRGWLQQLFEVAWKWNSDKTCTASITASPSHQSPNLAFNISSNSIIQYFIQ